MGDGGVVPVVIVRGVCVCVCLCTCFAERARGE